jgi:hypothetical protein
MFVAVWLGADRARHLPSRLVLPLFDRRVTFPMSTAPDHLSTFSYLWLCLLYAMVFGCSCM